MAKKPTLTAVVNRAFQVKPIITGPDDKKHWVDPQDVYRDNLYTELQTRGEAQNLKEIGSFSVEIPTGLRQMPAPKQVQILPEIPKGLMKDAVAYEVNFYGSSSGEDGYEVARVTVYSGPVPDDIKNQPVYAKGVKHQKRIPRVKKPKPAPEFNAVAAVELPHDVVAPEKASFAKKTRMAAPQAPLPPVTPPQP